MGKLILISGANDSGKSAFAESLIGQMKGDKYYIATMIPKTDDNFLRIRKHKEQRKNLGFQTLELPYNVALASVTSNSTVLLEDVSNILANNMFDKGKNADSVFCDICKLINRCKRVAAVSIYGLDENTYDKETSSYIHSLNEINQKLFNIADVAITMQDNIPVYQKGEPHEFF